jgi:hypothetical protein
MKRAASPAVSPVARRKAMTSWSVSRSISRIRSRSQVAVRMAGIAQSGMRPRRYQASQTAFSTASQLSTLRSSLQTAPISGLV